MRYLDKHSETECRCFTSCCSFVLPSLWRLSLPCFSPVRSSKRSNWWQSCHCFILRGCIAPTWSGSTVHSTANAPCEASQSVLVLFAAKCSNRRSSTEDWMADRGGTRLSRARTSATSILLISAEEVETDDVICCWLQLAGRKLTWSHNE